jgi:hypothetical protein
MNLNGRGMADGGISDYTSPTGLHCLVLRSMTMSLHETWVAAKKQAWKEFKEAQKNYLKELDKKIKAPTDVKSKNQAEKKALDLALGEVGLDKGESLDDYLKFADGFGKQLDAFEKAIDNNAKLKAKYNFAGEVDNVLKDKTAAKELLLFCQRKQGQATPMIAFYMKDYKKSAAEIWNEYVKVGSKNWIDASETGTLQTDWEDAAGDPNTLNAQGPKLINRLRDHVHGELNNSVVQPMGSDPTVLKNLGFVPSATIAALKKEVSDTAKKYDEQIQGAVNKWSKLKPQFWRPLDDALEQIKLYAEQH